MKDYITVDGDDLRRLQMNSDMLGSICCIVGRYSRKPQDTTLRCVEKLIEQNKRLRKQIRRMNENQCGK